MSRTLVARVSLVVILAAGGGLTLETAAASAAAPTRHVASKAAKPPKKKKPVTIKLATTPLGKVIVTTKGFTLYAFDPDGTDTVSPKCIDQCAGVWPAFVATKKTAGVGKGLKKSLLGIGGGGQVVYNDHFLYRFSGDTAVGQTNGNGIGGVWHAVDGTGAPLA
jgi:predicted lipoprotein with Yx(FWY)xxD motif